MGEGARLINVFLPQNPPEFADFRLREGDRGGGGGIEREWEERGEGKHPGQDFLKRKRQGGTPWPRFPEKKKKGGTGGTRFPEPLKPFRRLNYIYDTRCGGCKFTFLDPRP